MHAPDCPTEPRLGPRHRPFEELIYLSIPEIAARLCLSPETVRGYVREIVGHYAACLEDPSIRHKRDVVRLRLESPVLEAPRP